MSRAIASPSPDLPTAAPRRRFAQRLAWTGLGLALACGAGELLAAAGYRAHWWGVSGGIQTMRWSATAAIGAFVIALVAVIAAHRSGASRAARIAWMGLLLAALIAAPPLWFASHAVRLPSIHDISTDTVNPPRFVAVLPLRATSPNPVEYAAETATQQRAAYPDIAPMELELPPARTFDLADRAAREMGWEIVALVPAEGRIEATATTLMFGFKDDVVIRVSQASGGSRVDVRSVSRVGRSDLGANARRVRAFMKELAAQVRAN
jgi:uncharacterized protein (DUF1499 family)